MDPDAPDDAEQLRELANILRRGPPQEVSRLLDLLRKARKREATFAELAQGLSEENTAKDQTVSRLLRNIPETAGDRVLAQWPESISSRELMLWAMHTATSHSPRPGKKDLPFIGATRLQKIMYFLREYKFPFALNFIYEAYPYGVYSRNIEDELRRLAQDRHLVLLSERTVTADDDNSLHKFQLTEDGRAHAEDVGRSLERAFRVEQVQAAERLVLLLYEESAELLGAASKRHFTAKYWHPFLQIELDEFRNYLFRNAPSGSKPSLEYAYTKVESYLKAKAGSMLFDSPSDMLGAMRGMIPAGSFHQNRFFVFAGNQLPTNYFFPVDTYKLNSVLVKQFAQTVAAKLQGLRFDGIIYLLDGLPELIALQTAQCLPSGGNLQVIGPAMDRSDNVLLELNRLNPRGRYVVITSTVATGASLSRLVKTVRDKTDAQIVRAMAMADRGLGASSKLRDLGVPLDPVIRQDQMVNLLKWCSRVWPLN